MKHAAVNRLLSLVLTLALVLALAPSALAEDEPTPALTLGGVSISQQVSLKVGESTQLQATVTLTGGEDAEDQTFTDFEELSAVLPVTVDWQVDNGRGQEVEVTADPTNSLRATVLAKAIPATSETDPATVTVTVTPTAGGAGATSTCDVVVSPSDPTGLTVSPTSVDLSYLETASDHTQALSAAVIPSTASQAVTWRSADESIAMVESTGESTALVTGMAPGITQVYASSSAFAQEAACEVTVQGIVLEKKDWTQDPLRVGERAELPYTVYGSALQDKTVTWSTSDPTVVQVSSGYLYGVSEGTATISAQVSGYSSYSDKVTVTVKRNTADVITASMDAGAALSFSSLVSQINAQSQSVLGQPLSYISGLTVSTDQGTLYYRYASSGDTGDGVGSGQSYYVSPGSGQLSLSELSFVPKSDFSGTAVISYTGYASGSAFFQGTIQVRVAAQQDVSYSTANGDAVQFNASDFALVCRARTGRDLKYVTFSLPESSAGTLYYNYLSPQSPGTPVRASAQYNYSGTPSLGSVYFVPASGFDGTVTILYTAWNTNLSSYQGTVTIRVNAASQTGSLRYFVSQGSLVTFSADDFNTLCRDLTGYTLDRVQFTLPASSQGTLYYNYSASSSQKVTTSQSYYRSSYPYLSQVGFLAASSFTGTVSIPFTGWSSAGTLFSGTVSVYVGNQTNAISYQVSAGSSVVFDADDFNAYSQTLTGQSLRYVRFTLPASSQGTLYYDYNQSSSSNKVSASTNYYRTSSPYLNRVSFVPASNFSGTVSIPFTGWTTNDTRFTGTVSIYVSAQAGAISYQVSAGSSVAFNADDFNTYSQTVTGQSLRYVRFTLPASSQGTLYYNYNQGSYSSKVSASSNYYRSTSPYLSQVSFVPASSFSGTVSIPFTGWTTSDTRFTGTVSVKVTSSLSSAILYTTSYQPVTLRDADFRSDCSARGMGTLNSVQFTSLPSSSAGHLYSQYNGLQSANSEVRSGTKYLLSGSPALSQVTFVPKAGYRGTVTLSYTGTNSKNQTYQGQIRIVVSPNASSSYFTDMVSGYSWAASCVDFLYENGVVNGTGGGRYSPASPISRGSFLAMLDRALGLPRTSQQRFPDVPAGSYYADAIQAAYGLGIVNGYSDGTFRPDKSITRAEASAMLYRALQAMGWSIGSENPAVLSSYSDAASVPAYARGAMSVMVQSGILAGTTAGKLEPNRTMTRAEMAVVLARALTI